MVQGGIEGHIARLHRDGQTERMHAELEAVELEHQVQILAVRIAPHVKLEAADGPLRLPRVSHVEVKACEAALVVDAAGPQTADRKGHDRGALSFRQAQAQVLTSRRLIDDLLAAVSEGMQRELLGLPGKRPVRRAATDAEVGKIGIDAEGK